MSDWAPDLSVATLVIVDMQYATGHRSGALGRRMVDEDSELTDYRFDRIEGSVVPNIRRLSPVFRMGGGIVLYIFNINRRRGLAFYTRRPWRNALGLVCVMHNWRAQRAGIFFGIGACFEHFYRVSDSVPRSQ